MDSTMLTTRMLAITENISQAYGEHIRNYERKYAISELEKKRVMGENLNGTDYSDHDTDMCELSWWEDYFKPGYDARRNVYLNDRENFVEDVALADRRQLV